MTVVADPVRALFHAGASLGIAEAANQIARRGLAGRLDDNAVDVAAARDVLSRAVG